MNIQASVWRPWYTAVWGKHSLEEQIALAKLLQADTISIKGVNGVYVYGAEENFSALSPYRAHSNDAMERAAKDTGLEVDLWCWVDCKQPAAQARAIQDAVKRWNPRCVKLDVEGNVAKAYAHNTGAFLRSLGRLKRHDGTSVRVYLQSYRRPDLHREIAWEKWLTYEAEGDFILAGVAPQAYPMGSQDFVGDYGRMLEAYASLERQIGRELDWHVTLPTFRERGWSPDPDALIAGIDLLRAELGDRLVGVDFWRLGQLFEPWAEPLVTALAAYDWGPASPEPAQPFLELPEPMRWEIVRDDLAERGVIAA